ncbi:Chromatin assembly factor 1 subunit [Polyrhizophydium stewartii]|uniref:Chromatin assembly factor 1 subunit n=1 Tax=Polyrhizophydium stewartii TaxID=2732419 RepID=A0ABR4MZL2_9FUNG
MLAKTLQVLWHNRQPVFAADFEPVENGRLATCGGDNCVRVWRVVRSDAGEPSVEFLATLSRHSAAVNCVRWHPKDGSVLIWQQVEGRSDVMMIEDEDESKQTWRMTSLLRGASSDLYDLAWSPNGRFILSACVDNTCRIFDVQENKCIHVMTDHQHFVQGVAWDPLNQFVATQSSDRSMIVYSLQAAKHHGALTKQLTRHTKIDNAKLRTNAGTTIVVTAGSVALMVSSPSPTTATAPETMKSDSAEPQQQFQQQQQSSQEAVPDADQDLRLSQVAGLATTTTAPVTKAKPAPKSTRIFHDENLTSFFRRLSFSPDGALLVAPAGSIKDAAPSAAAADTANIQTTADATSSAAQPAVDAEAEASVSAGPPPAAASAPAPRGGSTNTVFIFGRGGLGSDPIMHLPGHKTAAIAVRFNPNKYELQPETSSPTIRLPYRLIFAVATQDSVVVYDTQHARPIAFLGNLHYATFTDVAWSSDGRTLVMTSTDGFCSIAEFAEGELGTIYSAAAVASATVSNGQAVSDNDVPMADAARARGPRTAAADTKRPASRMDDDGTAAAKLAPPVPAPVVAVPANPESAPKKRRIVPVFLGSATPAMNK